MNVTFKIGSATKPMFEIPPSNTNIMEFVIINLSELWQRVIKCNIDSIKIKIRKIDIYLDQRFLHKRYFSWATLLD